MNGKEDKEEKSSCCYFHPKQVVIGVCPLCLNERLLIVAEKQGHNKNHHRPFIASLASHRIQSSTHRASNSIHKIFAFGSLFRSTESQKLESDWNYDDSDDASPTSPEDSFISIKFEENGVASWEKNNKVPHHKDCVENNHKKMLLSKSMIEHGKANNAFRWRKRIGRMFHLIQWKRSTKVEGVKVRKGWMRTFTKRKIVE